MTLDTQAPSREQSTISTNYFLALAPWFGKSWLQAVPGAEPLSKELAWHLSRGLGLERGRKIKDYPKAMAMGKKTLVQMSLILHKYPLG